MQCRLSVSFFFLNYNLNVLGIVHLCKSVQQYNYKVYNVYCNVELFEYNVEYTLCSVYLQGVSKFSFVQCRMHLKLGKPTNLY